VDVQAAISAASSVQTADRTFSFDNAELGGGDFLRLMIEELMHQDPLEPIKNQELLAQVSQIKNMETLSNLDETLSLMTWQQQMATASALIGRAVSGVSTGGANVSGVVAGVQSSSADGVTLITETGDSIYVNDVTTIQEGGDDG